MMRIVPKRLFTLLGPSFLIASSIFLFGPFTVYQGNINEFVVPLTSILSFFLFPALIIVSVLCSIGLLLPEGIHRRYVSILFILGILIWVQGNFLVWEYGLLDGQSFDWTKDAWRGWVDGTLWLVLLVLAILFYGQIYRIVAFASIVLISLQLVLLASTSIQKPEIWKIKSSLSIHNTPPEEIFEFSSKQNVIHVVLDAFQSDIFQEIIDEEPDYYYTALEGFTFFKETTGSFTSTVFSIPAILSARNYNNDIPMQRFIDTVLKGRTIPNLLYDSGYEVDIIHAIPYYIKGRYSNSYLIRVPYRVTKQQYEQANSALILDVVLFRCAPHVLKKAVYNNQLWLIQRLLNQKDCARTNHFSHKAFLQDLIDNVSLNRSKPLYKFIHLLTPHPPLVVNGDCEYAGKVLTRNRENIKIQQKCSLDHFVEFLDKLKLMGIYESALIVVNADHGVGTKVKMKTSGKRLYGAYNINKEFLASMAGYALPLMIIKPPYGKGPLRISAAQTMLTDIPTTISSILNLNEEFNGCSVFEIAPHEVRERKYFHYRDFANWNWQSDFLSFNEYIIEGSVFDTTSWRLGLTYHLPESSFQAKKIDFGTKEASGFLRLGWGGNESNAKEGTTYNWALGNSASIFLSLPKNEAVRLTVNVKTLKFNKSQHVTVKVDNKEIGTWELSPIRAWEKHSIVIEPDENRPDVSVVEFTFSQYRKPQEEGDHRPLAVLFESLTLSEVG
jgi:hypothetical protein